MRQSRSADPWSSFLRTQQTGSAPAAGGPAGEGRDSEPRSGGGDREPGRDLPGNARAVLSLVSDRPRALTVEEIGERLGLGLLEVADAIEPLTERGLVRIRRFVGRECVEPTARGADEAHG